MKRFLAVVLAMALMLTMAFAFTACSKGECEMCGQTASLKTFKAGGESAKLCGTCHDIAKAFASFADF